MTMLGSRKVNKKGRSTGQLNTNRRTKIHGQFAPRTIEMLESPAFRVLSLSARRVLDRVEIEFSHHGGQDNGKLPVTFDDFARYGINRQQIAPAIRECEALGFLQVTERGRAGNAEFRTPNLFRLTYRPTGGAAETNEWRRIETPERAEQLAGAARQAKRPQPKKQNPSAGRQTGFSAENQHRKPQIHSVETSTTAIVPKPTLLSISPGREALREWSTPTLTGEYLAVEREATRPKRVSARLTAKQYRDLSGRLN
jgi:hypothetical protein